MIKKMKQSRAQKFVDQITVSLRDTRDLAADFAPLTDHTCEDGVALQRLYSYSPGRGLAREAMEAAIQLADRMKVTLYLESMPDSTDTDGKRMSQKRLDAFYRSFGFEGNGLMCRTPKRPKPAQRPRSATNIAT